MTKNEKRLYSITEQLNKGDEVLRKQAAIDMVAYIHEVRKINKKELLAAQIIDVLADFAMEDEWNECYSLLSKSSTDMFRYQAIYAKAWRLNKNISPDSNAILQTFLEGVKFAEANKNNSQLADFLCRVGECYMKLGLFDEALKVVTQSMALANNAHNPSLVALNTYYTGIILFCKSLPQCALDKLREASNLAVDNKFKWLTKQSEVMRAYYTLETGDVEGAKTILHGWMENFAIL